MYLASAALGSYNSTDYLSCGSEKRGENSPVSVLKVGLEFIHIQLTACSLDNFILLKSNIVLEYLSDVKVMIVL